ncbi:MAG: zf-HC2 domain-containing protein [Bacteroidota bacterium]
MSYPDHKACEQHEEALNLYLDGELSFEAQPELFEHLASCSGCRETFNTLLTFRAITREERIVLPMLADEAVLRRLNRSKQSAGRRDRVLDRRPLWQSRPKAAYGAAAALGMVLILFGTVLTPRTGSDLLPGPVQAEAQPIETVALEATVPAEEVVYYFYPGITVEETEEASEMDEADTTTGTGTGGMP